MFVQEDWEDDHYFVVLGMDDKYVYYQDPFAKRATPLSPIGCLKSWYVAE
jgi:uncharacterized protein YvpB